jgi:hypothetical protein
MDMFDFDSKEQVSSLFDKPGFVDFKGDGINIAEFSGELVNVNENFESRYIKPPISNDVDDDLLKYEDAVKLAKDIVISKGSRHFAIINGSFIFGDFIEALIVENNWHIKKMTISTLSMSDNNIDSLANLLNGDYVDALDLIVSVFFFSHERHNLIKYMYEELDKKNKFQLAVAATHCKTCIFETHCGKFIVMHGSPNLRSSNNIEQFVVEENEVLYNFNHEYQMRIIEKFKTINKAVRNTNLWSVVK